MILFIWESWMLQCSTTGKYWGCEVQKKCQDWWDSYSVPREFIMLIHECCCTTGGTFYSCCEKEHGNQSKVFYIDLLYILQSSWVSSTDLRSPLCQKNLYLYTHTHLTITSWIKSVCSTMKWQLQVFLDGKWVVLACHVK